MNWKKWLHGLAGAFIGGAATAIGGSVASGGTMGPKAMGGAALGGAIISGALYLRQSPIPPPDPPCKQQPPDTK